MLHIKPGDTVTVRFLPPLPDNNFGKHLIPKEKILSADNGVYILPVHTRYGRAYYVKPMQAVENLMSDPDRKDGYNSAEVIMFMVDSTKYTDRVAALEAAHDLMADMTVCEYGVQELPPVKLED